MLLKVTFDVVNGDVYYAAVALGASWKLNFRRRRG